MEEAERLLFCRLRWTKILSLSRERPHPAGHECPHRLAPSAFLARLHATLCPLEATKQTVGGKRRKMLAQCLGLSKHHERMLNTPNQKENVFSLEMSL